MTMQNQKVSKYIWLCICTCIAFGCWMMIFLGYGTGHAVVINPSVNPSISSSYSSASEDVSVVDSESNGSEVTSLTTTTPTTTSKNLHVVIPTKSETSTVVSPTTPMTSPIIGKDTAVKISKRKKRSTHTIVTLSGKGTQQRPYQISSYTKLKEFSRIVNEGNSAVCAKLTADIDCGTTSDWVPIGNETHKYKGTVDGMGHKIINLCTHSKPSKLCTYSGLFGYLDSEGIIKNVGLQNARIRGTKYSGGIVGYNDGGTIESCYNSGLGSIDGTTCVGGIAGYNNGIIKNCYSIENLSISGCTRDKNISVCSGGLVGENIKTVQNCYSSINGDIIAQSYENRSNSSAGGLVGLNLGTIKRCFNNGGGNIKSKNVSVKAAVDEMTGSEPEKAEKVDSDVDEEESESAFGKANSGGIAGYNRGFINKCYNNCTGNITAISDGNASAGGVAGINSIMESCYNSGKGNITAKSKKAYAYVGGVAGVNEMSIEKCYSNESGDIIGKGLKAVCAGGVLGLNKLKLSKMKNCYSNGSGSISTIALDKDETYTCRKATFTYVGGVAGYNSGALMWCYSSRSNSISTNSKIRSYIGGAVGLNCAGAYIAGCYYDTKCSMFIDGTKISDENKKTLGISYTNTIDVAGLSTVKMTKFNVLIDLALDKDVWQAKNKDTFCRYYPHLKGFEYDLTKEIIDWPARIYVGTHGTADMPYQILDYSTLKEFARIANEENNVACAILTNNIDCEKTNNWIPIGDDTHPYVGTFNGNGHRIIGLSNDAVELKPKYAGLFGYIGSNGIVQNISIESLASMSGQKYTGSLAGYNKGTIQNCYNSGNSIINGAVAGGIAGYNEGRIQNCYNSSSGTINGATIGGVVGCNNGILQNCFQCGSSNIFATKSNRIRAGGVVGYNLYDGTVVSCNNSGNSKIVAISEEDNECTTAGGVVGENNGTMHLCYNGGCGIVKILCMVGIADCGGITGYNSGTMKACHNSGSCEVIAEGSERTYVGGILGYNYGTVESCYNNGSSDITAMGLKRSYVGGVIGYCGKDKIVKDYYNAGSGTITSKGFIFTDMHANKTVGYKDTGKTASHRRDKSYTSDDILYGINTI